tara:strand:- start:640 stop:759 length:120 start_codon:yes stop_codon:yes gene_type:complete
MDFSHACWVDFLAVVFLAMIFFCFEIEFYPAVAVTPAQR